MVLRGAGDDAAATAAAAAAAAAGDQPGQRQLRRQHNTRQPCSSEEQLMTTAQHNAQRDKTTAQLPAELKVTLKAQQRPGAALSNMEPW